MFIDSHCHLDFPEFQSRLPEVLANMKSANVSHALCVSVDIPDFPKVQDAITQAGLKPEMATIAMRPETEIALEGDQAESMQKLLDALENLDDVQDVYSNATFI